MWGQRISPGRREKALAFGPRREAEGRRNLAADRPTETEVIPGTALQRRKDPLFANRAKNAASEFRSISMDLVQEILAVQRVALGRTEAGIANNPPQFFFCCAVGYAGGTDDVFFEHHGADVVVA